MIYCHQRSYIISTTYHQNQKNPLIPQICTKKKLNMNFSKKGDSYSEASIFRFHSWKLGEYSTRRTTRTRTTTATTTTIEGCFNTPVEHTPGNPPNQWWKKSLFSLLVKVFSGCVPVRCVEKTFETNNDTLTPLHILRGLCLLNGFPHHLGIRSRPGNSQWAMKQISGCLIRIIFNTKRFRILSNWLYVGL